LARKYITERFAACGLKPWGDSKSYAQPFGIGTNMIGILPGSDPELAEEIIIVSAHYDHLGKTKKGTCLGAADNATGMAAMLEIAEFLSLSEKRPRRTICFAAFDCEEMAMMGAFTFTCRDDFDSSKLAGVVNIDLLGRRGFDVLDNHLFVSGTTEYPALRDRLKQSEADANIEVLPISMDLAAARGDHFAFEGMDACTLFFSCGLYADYHKPGDTPEKIDYEQIRRSTRVILDAVQYLADSPAAPLKESGQPGLQEELHTSRKLMALLQQESGPIGWTPEEAASLTELISQLDGLIEEKECDMADWHRLMYEHPDVMIRLMLWPQEEGDHAKDPLKLISDNLGQRMIGMLVLEIRPEFNALLRAIAAHLDRSRLQLILGAPDFNYKREILCDEHLYLHPIGDDEYVFLMIYFNGSVNVNMPGIFKWPPRMKPSGKATFSHKMTGSRGSREALLESSLIEWGKDSSVSTWDKAISLITGLPGDRTYEEWLSWHLETKGYEDKNEWMRACIVSPDYLVACTAIRSLTSPPDPSLESILSRIIGNSAAHPFIRQDAIAKVHEKSSQQAFDVLVSVVDDQAEGEDINFRELLDDYPKVHIYDFTMSNGRKSRELKTPSTAEEKQVPKTVGDYALHQLKKVTGEDFGVDKEAWRLWFKQSNQSDEKASCKMMAFKH
jgi:hypothetical protein